MIGFAHVAAHDPQKRLVYGAAVRKTHDWNVQPLFVDAMRIGPKPTPANIDDMGGTGEEAHQFIAMKHGRDHGEIVQVAGPLPRVVGDIDVALGHGIAPDAANEMSDCIGHCVDVARRARDRLGQHPALRIIDASRQIPGLSD